MLMTASPPAAPHAPNLLRNVVAGLVVFFVAIPLCLGIAHVSGAPMQAGLLSGILGGLLVGALSGSSVSVSGPAAGLAAVVVAQMQDLGSFEAFLCAVTVSGVLQVLGGALRAGALASYVPSNVIRGLLASIGIVLILKQIPHLVGHDADWEGEMSFFQPDGQNTFSELLRSLEMFVPGAALTGLACLGLLVVWPRTPLARTPIPAPIGAVLLGVLLSELLRATGSEWVIADSHLVALPLPAAGESPWTHLVLTPDLTHILNPRVLLAGLTLAIVASLETLLNLEATDKLDPQRRVSPPNRELVAQGVGNIAAGLLGALPMTSVIVRSSVNAQAGATNRVSTMTHGALLLGSVVFIPQLLNRIPLSALAAILMVTGFKLAGPKVFKSTWQQGKAQFIPFLVTIVAIVLTDLLIGVLIGLGTSITFILASNLRRGFSMVREDHVSGVLHRIELAGQTSFLNRARLTVTLNGFHRGDQVLLDARLADYVDPDILSLIHEFVNETAPARGVKVSTVGFQARYSIDDVVRFVDWTTREIQASLTAARVVQLLKDGNERFATGHRIHRDLVRQLDGTADGQNPMAVILSCIDSRSPAEILFDLGLGDIFSCRLAGNVASEKVLGSMEFACKVASAKLIVVLGHTRCGAVKAACDFVDQGVTAMAATGLTNLGAVTDAIAHAVRDEAAHRHVSGPRTSHNSDFVDSVAAANVRHTMAWILQNSPVLASMVSQGDIGIAGAIYDIAAGRVNFFEGPGA